MKTKIRPLFDRVVIKEVKSEEKTVGGIYLPTNAQEKPSFAEVVAVGNEIEVDGKVVKMQVKIGDKVLFSKYAGTEVKLNNETFIVLKQTDILAVLED